MDWVFKFVTYSRRELGDYKYTIEVTDEDSYTQAVKKAAKQLPLGEKDNIYNRHGVEWEVQDVWISDDEDYTNDKNEED